MYKLEYKLDLKELSIEDLKNLQEDIKNHLRRRHIFELGLLVSCQCF